MQFQAPGWETKTDDGCILPREANAMQLVLLGFAYSQLRIRSRGFDCRHAYAGRAGRRVSESELGALL